MIIILVCVLVFANILIKTIIVLKLRETICKTFSWIVSLFFWMIDWSIIKFVTYKAFLRTTILKFIIWSITKFISIKFNSSIEWWFISTIIRWFISSIMFINEIMIIRFIFVLIILLRREWFSNDLVTDYTWLQNIHQSEDFHWWIDYFVNQYWMISTDFNNVLS
jgi:hypothetical protein